MGRGKSKYIFFLACAVLFVFAALRYMYGNDYPGYYAHYLSIQAGNTRAFDERLYVLLNQLSPSFFVLIAVTSLAFVYCIYRLIIDTLSTRYAWMGLLIFVISPYLFLMNLSAIRQCLAMVCFIVAVGFALKRNPIGYFAMVIVAMMFHKSAVLLLPIWFVANTKPVRAWMVCAVAAAMALLLFVVDVDAFVVAVAGLFDDSSYVYYATQGVRNSVRATLLSSLYFIYVLGNLPRLQGRALVYGKLYLLGTIFGLLAFRISSLTRIQMYFDIFAVVVIPAILQADQERGPVRVRRENIPAAIWDILNRFALPALIFLVYALRYYAFFTNSSWTPFFEYHTIFSAY